MPVEDYCDEGTAAYVVLKGCDALDQGRPLTLPFQGVTNPQDAFAHAAFAWLLDEIAINNGFHADFTVTEPGVFAFSEYAKFGSAYDHIEALVRVRNVMMRNARLEKRGENFVLSMASRRIAIPNYQLRVTLNGVEVRVDFLHEEYAQLLSRDWERAQLGLLANPIGPQAAPFTQFNKFEFEKAQKAADSRFMAAVDTSIQRAARREELEQRLTGLRPTEYKDEQLWLSAKSIPRDDASRRIFAATEAWMQLMQDALDRGKDFDQMAFQFFKEVDVAYALPHNTAGSMANMIISVWRYGTSFGEYWDSTHFRGSSTT